MKRHSHTADEVPVLLTSSVIAFDDTVNLKNTDERIRLTLESIAHWIRISPNTPLVICDGSNFDFSSLVKANYPAVHVECLFFDNNQQLVKIHGRGYGEGEIIRYALDNSAKIREAGCFAKCSAKLWVENFNTCLTYWNKNLLLKCVFDNVFSPFKETKFSYVDTRFYVVSISTYNKYFSSAHHQIDIARGHGIEDTFRDILINSNLKQCAFASPPIICGVGGGIGKYYKNSKIRVFKEYLRYKLVFSKKKFTELLVIKS